MEKRMLVVFYSLFQNTAELAMEIALEMDGELRELVPEEGYSFDYNTAAKEVRNQVARGFCPKLRSGNESVEGFDVIFIGSPNWFRTLAPPVLTFLRSHDFKGKTVIPFCTHGGGRFGDMLRVITKVCEGAEILSGFEVNGTAESGQVAAWLEGLRKELMK